MAYIYKIINDINNKIYIGKTEFPIEKRFKEHCKDAFREKNENRPLYNAMNKYGVEHFHIELIEETFEPELREQYWINYYNSFKNGYNATLGGDGKHYIDYQKIINLYLSGLNQTQVAKTMNIDVGTVRKVLNSYHIEKHKVFAPNAKEILQINKDTNEIINTFLSSGEAARYLINNNISKGNIKSTTSKILEVARGQRKTAYSYGWRFK